MDQRLGLSQLEVLSLTQSAKVSDHAIVRAYLDEIASSFTAAEAFAVIAFVDTPDVLD